MIKLDKVTAIMELTLQYKRQKTNEWGDKQKQVNKQDNYMSIIAMKDLNRLMRQSLPRREDNIPPQEVQENPI